jgi:hypothetical protein
MRSQTQPKLVKVRNRSKAEVSCYSNVNGVSYGNHIEVTPFTIADRGDARPTRPAHAGRGKPNPTKSDKIQVKNSRGISITCTIRIATVHGIRRIVLGPK